MRAILVLKEMPKECDECPFYDGAWGVYCMATNEPVKADEKSSWCPLKEMPKKMDEEDYRQKVNGNGDYYEQVIGWNACIEEIEK